MIGPDPAQPGAIYSTTSWGESFRQPGIRERSSIQHDVELVVLGRRDLAVETPSPGGADIIHLPRRRAKHPSELNAISRFWNGHVHLSVEHKACRDHLGTFVWLKCPCYCTQGGLQKRIAVWGMPTGKVHED